MPLSNYINDNARMEVPPDSFLQRFYDFDAMLVFLPSRLVPFAYVVARRRQYSVGLTSAALDATITQPDTKMCLAHGLVPVCLMYKTGPSWDPDPLLRSLAARDTWTHGGGDKCADLLEEQEALAATKMKADIRDDMWNRSGDAWRSYQARTGQRVVSPGLTPRQERRIELAPSGSTAGFGSTE